MPVPACVCACVCVLWLYALVCLHAYQCTSVQQPEVIRCLIYRVPPCSLEACSVTEPEACCVIAGWEALGMLLSWLCCWRDGCPRSHPTLMCYWRFELVSSLLLAARMPQLGCTLLLVLLSLSFWSLIN